MPASHLDTFTSGAIVGGRFKIVRLIAQGGGGEVYEAMDLELHENLALKTIRSEIADNPEAANRFKREILLARKVTHPNVCRTFDIFHHHVSGDGSGPDRDISFLTMELLRGKTLSELIKNKGAMQTSEALPIVRQMAAALDAAHRAGVIHRDFKSGNVMLVEAAQEEGGLHAVITDFGLANTVVTHDSLTPEVTQAGTILGTPAYMAPEQAEGKEITAAADIYALGVVLYEMVTGSQPFAGESMISTIVKKIKEPAPSPRSLVPDLDPVWESVIVRCLDPAPENRFSSALDVVHALEGRRVSAPMRENRKPALLLLIVFLAVILATGIFLFRRPSPTSTTTKSSFSGRRSVAVLGFKNLSGRTDCAWVSTALSEMLTTELSAGEKLRTIPGENVARMKLELSLPDADSLANDTLSRIRSNLGTDYVVLGSYLDLGKDSGGKLRVDLRLQDTQLGETIATVGLSGNESEMVDLVSGAGEQLRSRLGLSRLSPTQQTEMAGLRPSSADAARLYSEALDKLRAFDVLAARDLLLQTTTVDPKFPLAHSALAEVWSKLGYDGKALESAQRAFELSAGLPRADRMLVEGRYHETAREFDKASEIYKTLFEFFPDNLDYGIRLASVQTLVGKGPDALATLKQLRKLPPPASADPRIDLTEAETSGYMSLFKEEKAAADRAIQKGRALGEKLLLARALLARGWAEFRMGFPEDAAASYDEGAKIFAAAGDRGGEAWAMRRKGFLLSDKGDLKASQKMYENALDIAHQIGDKKMESEVLAGLAIVLYNRGELASGQARLQSGIEIRTEAGDRVYRSTLLNNLGLFLRELGKYKESQQVLQEAIAYSQENPSSANIGYPLYNLGEVLMAEGDLSKARQALDQAYKILSEKSEKRGMGYVLYGRGQVEMYEDHLKEARTALQQSLDIRKDIHDEWSSSRNKIFLGWLALEESQPSNAIDLANQALEASTEQGAKGNEAWAQAVLAGAYLQDGKVALARDAVERGLQNNPENFTVRSELEISAARIEFGSGTPEDFTRAEQRLKRLLDGANEADAFVIQLNVRLAQGDLARAAGQADKARAIFTAVEKDAKSRNFLLLARKAAAAAARL